MTAMPSVLELPTATRTWWVEVLDSENRWKWTPNRDRATVFPSVAAADRFRTEHCRLFLTAYEKRALHAQPV